MAQTIISIESALRTAQIKSGNFNQWETILNNPVVIEEGDVIMMKNAFINNDSLSSSNILIESDIVLEMEFYYYYINGIQNTDIEYQSQNSVTGQAGIPNAFFPVMLPNFLTGNLAEMTDLLEFNKGSQILTYNEPLDFEPYVLYKLDDNNNKVPVVGQKNITIKAGSYSPSQLASMITIKLSTVDTNITGFNDYSKGTGLGNYQLNTLTPFLYSVGNNTSSAINHIFISPNDGPSNVESARAWEPIFYDGRNNNPNWATVRTPDPLYLLDPDNNAQLLVGANQISLDFIQETGVFQWSYMHSPLQAKASFPNSSGISEQAGGQDVGVMVNLLHKDFNNPVNDVYRMSPLMVQTKQSGILWKSLEPKSFWQTLGFNLDLITQNIEVNGYTLADIKAKTTDAQIGISEINNLCINQASEQPQRMNFFNSLINTPINNLANNVNYYYPNFITLSNLNITPIIAQNSYNSSSNISYYLIDSEFGPSNDFEADGFSMSSISAIGSRFFQSSNFLTMFSDSAIPYQHVGSPFTISSIKISIRDSTKNLASGLRGNSSIVFQVYKTNSSASQNEEQPTEKSKIPKTKNPMIR